ncbi:MAG TPA: hypothetical protein VM715_07475, partial [Candidatus Acidoferrum sp.]|nr:hypothetical protein [Candidatus Acidoferrum sp.]
MSESNCCWPRQHLAFRHGPALARDVRLLDRLYGGSEGDVAMRVHAKFLNGFNLFLPVQSRREKYSGFRRAQISSQQRRLVPMRGGSRSS